MKKAKTRYEWDRMTRITEKDNEVVIFNGDGKVLAETATQEVGIMPIRLKQLEQP